MADGDTSLDAQLELKKRARRRLVGASALALLAAVVLPMVMDHEPRPPTQDIQVRIPGQDGGGFASRVMPAKPTATPLPPVESKAVPPSVPETKADPKAEPKQEAKTESKPEPKPELKPEPKPEPVAVAKPDKGAEKPQDKPAAKPADKSVDKKSEESRAAAALSGAEGGGAWVVQLGAYKEAGNVKLLMAKLKEMKVPAYTEHFDSPQGQRTRVRAGPFPSKDAAEKAKSKIKVLGVDGPVAPK